MNDQELEIFTNVCGHVNKIKSVLKDMNAVLKDMNSHDPESYEYMISLVEKVIENDRARA